LIYIDDQTIDDQTIDDQTIDDQTIDDQTIDDMKHTYLILSPIVFYLNKNISNY
jgi:hypothetical protein